MAWNGPDQQNQCKMTDLAKLPKHSYPGDDDEIPDSPQGQGLRGYQRLARRPQEATAGEIEDNDAADESDKQTERMKEFRSEYGGHYMRPPRGEDF